jgi:AraC-like DNA-binding protein/exonuclease VII small subunit
MNGISRFIFCFFFFSAIYCSGISEKLIQNNIANSFSQEKLNITIDTSGIQQLFDLYLKNRKSNPYSALNYLHQAQVIASTIHNEEKIALILYHKGYLYRMLGIYNFAIKSYIASLNYFERVNDKDMMAWIYLDIGNLYFIQKDKSSIAIEHYEKAATLFSELGETQGVVVANNNIGLIYKDKKEYDKALTYFYKDANLCNEINDAEDHVLALSYIGQVYLLKNKKDSAKKYFDKGFQLATAKKLKEWIAYSYDNYASIDNARKHTEQAIKNYENALALYRETDDKLNIATILQKMSNVYAQDKDYKKAIEYSLQALEVAEQNKLISSSFEILPMLADYYDAIMDHTNAFYYLNKYHHLKESDIVRSQQQVQEEYEKDIRNKEKELFDKEQALKDSEISQQRFIIYFSLLGFIVFLLLFAVILWRNRQLKDSYHHLFENSVELIKKDQELQEIKKKEKYATSLLSDEANTILYNSLLKLVEEEKIYMNNKLTIEDVAKKLNTNRTYLSQIINEKTSTNFNNFINKYRVLEAQICLLNDEIKAYNIEGIAQTVGFSSKSTFNGAFKKFTGLTPSEFMQMKRNTATGNG